MFLKIKEIPYLYKGHEMSNYMILISVIYHDDDDVTYLAPLIFELVLYTRLQKGTQLLDSSIRHFIYLTSKNTIIK